MRLMFVTGSLRHGGAEHHSIALMNGLAARGHECHAVYIKSDASQIGRIEQRDGGTLRCLAAEAYLEPRAVDDFARHLRRIEPAAIVTANAHALLYAMLARRRAALKVPVLATYHSTLLVGVREKVKMLYMRLFFRAADCLVFVSENQRRHWRRRALLARRVEVIHNGVDLERFSAGQFAAAARRIRQEYGIADEDYLIGMVAVLRPEKNHVQLLSALATLRRRGIAAKALLIGDGPMRASIEECARLLGVDRCVTIAGFKEDVRPYVAACDVVLLCSLTETFSLAAIEAMAMSRPVVHSAVGGAAEMIEPGHNGYLYPVRDTEALVDRLTVLSDRELARGMGRNARALVEKRFSREVMLDRYERTLRELCRPPPSDGATWRQEEWGANEGINYPQYINKGVKHHDEI